MGLLKGATPFRGGCVVLISTCVGAVSLSAASFQLGPKEIEDAIRTGKQSLIQEEFGAEWRQINPSGHELIVQTPFYRVALLARLAAFKGEEPDKSEIGKLLKASQNRILFWVSFQGPRSDFAKAYRPALLVAGKEVKPAFVQNERTALLIDRGRYLARSLYAFPADEVDPRGLVSLVVRSFEGQEVSRFQVNLATMR